MFKKKFIYIIREYFIIIDRLIIINKKIGQNKKNLIFEVEISLSF